MPEAVKQHATAVVSYGQETSSGRKVERIRTSERRPLRGPVRERRAGRRVDDFEGVALLVGCDHQDLRAVRDKWTEAVEAGNIAECVKPSWTRDIPKLAALVSKSTYISESM